MINNLTIGADPDTFFNRENIDKIRNNPHWAIACSNFYTGPGDTMKEKYQYFMLKLHSIFNMIRIGTWGGEEWIVASPEIGSMFEVYTLFEPITGEMYEKEKQKEIAFSGHVHNNIKLYTDVGMIKNEFCLGINTEEKHTIFGSNARIIISDWDI